MKRNHGSRLRLNRETLCFLEPSRLHQAFGAGPDRGTVTGCPGITRLNLCSEAPNKCHLTDPTKNKVCTLA